MSEEWHLAFGVDAGYVRYAGVLMTSVILNNLGQPICFHVACDGLADEDKAKLDEFTLIYRNTRVIIYDVRGILETIRVGDVAPERLNRSVFLRILLPQFLPRELTRVVYLDADMLCVGSLAGLWQSELGDRVLAATLYEEAPEHTAKLGMADKPYFNAGVMVINLPVWRREKLTGRVLDLYRQRAQEFKLLEQDCLNFLLAGQVAVLDRRYNHMISAFNPLQARLSADDVLLHFANEGKPWFNYAAEHIKKLYWSYVRRSQWFELEPLEPWEVKSLFLAGKNAQNVGDYKTAAQYLGKAAQTLLKYYLEQTGQLNPQLAPTKPEQGTDRQ